MPIPSHTHSSPPAPKRPPRGDTKAEGDQISPALPAAEMQGRGSSRTCTPKCSRAAGDSEAMTRMGRPAPAVPRHCGAQGLYSRNCGGAGGRGHPEGWKATLPQQSWGQCCVLGGCPVPTHPPRAPACNSVWPVRGEGGQGPPGGTVVCSPAAECPAHLQRDPRMASGPRWATLWLASADSS